MDIQKYILKELQKRGADDTLIALTDADNLLVKFSNNEINTTKTWNSINLGVFLSMNRRIVYNSIKDLSANSVKESINSLIKFAKSVEENKLYRGIAKGPFKYKEIKDTYDRKITALDEKAVKFVEQGINKAIENGAKRTAGTFLASSNRIKLFGSNDVNAEEAATSLYFSIRALQDKEASGHMVALSRVLSKFNPKVAAETAAEISVMAKNPKQGKRGRLDVIFGPMAASNLLEHVGSAASIFSVESGLSFLKDKVGKKVAGNAVNIYDDGRLQNGYGSTKFDAEGVPTQKTSIIEEGVLKTYLYNTSSAKRYNVKTTANAGLINPEPHNLILKTGGYKKDELFKDMKKGLYITNVWYTRFNNYTTGDFSTIPRDGIFYIENGSIKHPVKGIRISDNLLRMLSNTVALAKDSVQVQGWDVDIPVVTPHLLINDVNITTSVS